MPQINLSPSQIASFNKDGFVIVEDVLEESQLEAARERFPALFRGEFETGLQPDEWNWQEGLSNPDMTRQICNGWKSDRTIASIVLREDIGKACAELHAWAGARINQDNIIWKPPGAKSLGFHQDDSYQQWIVPGEMMTCWITLDDTLAGQGTIEYVKGSHLWPLSPPIKQFHAPEDPLADLQQAARLAGVNEPLITPIEIPAGSAVIHHGRTWHGSRSNRRGKPRRSVISHCMPDIARFHDNNVSPVYSRYKRRDNSAMDESFFPVLWRTDGYRTAWLESNGKQPLKST